MCTCKQCLDTTCTCEECEALLNPNKPNLLSPDQDKHFFISYQGKKASKLTLASLHFASGLHQTAQARSQDRFWGGAGPPQKWTF